MKVIYIVYNITKTKNVKIGEFNTLEEAENAIHDNIKNNCIIVAKLV